MDNVIVQCKGLYLQALDRAHGSPPGDVIDWREVSRLDDSEGW